MLQTQFSPERRARWLLAAVLLCGGLAAAAWYRFDAAAHATYELRTHDNVSGLAVGAPVEYHGVEIGKVASVELAGPATVRVLLRVREDAPLTGATVAAITSRGLASRGFTGDVYVTLDDDGRMPVPLSALPGRPYPQLRTAAARSVSLDTAVAQVSENVQAMSRLTQRALDERSVASLHQSLDGLQQVTRALAGNAERIASMTANLERASRRLGPLLDAGDRTAAALQGQVLPQAYDALTDLQRLTTTLGGLAQRLQRDPSLLVRLSPSPPAAPAETP